MRTIVLAAAALALSGCATGPIMDVAQCQVADWRQLGYQDAAGGVDASRFAARDQACMTAGYPGKSELYMAGHAEGLRVFCTPQNAFRTGLDGRSYGGQCPPDLDPQFRTAYRDGREIYDATSALRAVESALNSLRSDRENIERKIAMNEQGLYASQSDAERERHRNELFRLRSERNRVENDMRDRERELRWRAQDVSRLRFTVGSPYGNW
jgi:hypothetical protein